MNYYFEKDIHKCVFDIYSGIKSNISKCSSLSEKILMKKIEDGELTLPVVNVKCFMINYESSSVDYLIRNKDREVETKKSDFVNTIGGNMDVEISVYSKEITELITLEEQSVNLLDKGIETESNESGFDDCVMFTIKRNVTKDIGRKTINYNDEHIYCSVINTTVYNVVEWNREYHSAVVELDRICQLELLGRYSSLLQYINNNDIKQDSPINKAKDNIVSQFGKVLDGKNDEEIYDLYYLMKENNADIKKAVEIKEAGNKSKELSNREHDEEQKKYDDAFAIVEQRKNQRTVEIEEYERNVRQLRIEAEKNEKDRINKEYLEMLCERRKPVFKSFGDPNINRYTNAVAEYLAERINYKVYNGTFYMKCLENMFYGTDDSPFVLCVPNARFHTQGYTYININNDGVEKIHQHHLVGDITSYPLDYSVEFQIRAHNKEDIEKIGKLILSVLKDDITVDVADPYYPDELVRIKIYVKKDIKIDVVDLSADERKYKGANIRTEYYRTVYYGREYSDEEIQHDPWRQFRLLQQAQYYFAYKNDLDRYISKIKYDYSDLVSKASLPMFGLGYSHDYKDLKVYINNARDKEIIRPLFEKVFKEQLLVYPQLFDRCMAGYKYEQIESEVNEIIAFYKAKTDRICKQLNIKKIDNNILINYLSGMEKNRLCTVEFIFEKNPADSIVIVDKSEADKEFYKKIEEAKQEDIKIINDAKPSWVKEKEKKEREEKEKQERERREREKQEREKQERLALEAELLNEIRYNREVSNTRNDDYYEDRNNNSNNDGGFISNTLSNAIGTYWGNKALENQIKQQRKEEKEREDKRKRDEYIKDFNERSEYNYRRNQIIHENQERSRKGLPQLPVPPFR